MKLSCGGTVNVSSYETDTQYCVCVEDDGAGFAAGTLLDESKHIGLKNIRGRLICGEKNLHSNGEKQKNSLLFLWTGKVQV